GYGGGVFVLVSVVFSVLGFVFRRAILGAASLLRRTMSASSERAAARIVRTARRMARTMCRRCASSPGSPTPGRSVAGWSVDGLSVPPAGLSLSPPTKSPVYQDLGRLPSGGSLILGNGLRQPNQGRPRAHAELLHDALHMRGDRRCGHAELIANQLV